MLIIFTKQPKYLPTSGNLYNPDVKIIYKFVNEQKRNNKIKLLDTGTIYKKARIIKNKIKYEKGEIKGIVRVGNF